MEDFTTFLQDIPIILQVLDTKEKLIGLVLLLLPFIIFLGLRDMNQPAKGFITVVCFLCVLLFAYNILYPTMNKIELSRINNVPALDENPRKKKDDDRQFIIANSDKRLLTMSDLKGMDKATLELARNEIFARRRRYFKKSYLRKYFSRFSWYNPNTWDPQLSKIEQKNVDLILKAEK